MTPGTLVVLSFYIRGCPILHGEGNCLFSDVGTVVSSREEVKDVRREVGHMNMSLVGCRYTVKCEQNLLVSAGGFPLIMVLTGPSFELVKLEWSVELGFDQRQK